MGNLELKIKNEKMDKMNKAEINAELKKAGFDLSKDVIETVISEEDCVLYMQEGDVKMREFVILPGFSEDEIQKYLIESGFNMSSKIVQEKQVKTNLTVCSQPWIDGDEKAEVVDLATKVSAGQKSEEEKKAAKKKAKAKKAPAPAPQISEGLAEAVEPPVKSDIVLEFKSGSHGNHLTLHRIMANGSRIPLKCINNPIGEDKTCGGYCAGFSLSSDMVEICTGLKHKLNEG